MGPAIRKDGCSQKQIPPNRDVTRLLTLVGAVLQTHSQAISQFVVSDWLGWSHYTKPISTMTVVNVSMPCGILRPICASFISANHIQTAARK